MIAHRPARPVQGLGAAGTVRVTATELTRTPAPTRDAPADLPPGIVLCWFCGTHTEDPEPVGWVVAVRGADGGVASAHGSCPECVHAQGIRLGAAGGWDLQALVAVATPSPKTPARGPACP